MKLKEIAEGMYMLPLGNVNAYLLKAGEGLILIDTGTAGNAGKILDAIRSMGYRPSELKSILLTHCHPDHAGSAAALKRKVPQVKIYASEWDAPMIAEGLNQRKMTASPGLFNKLLFNIFVTDSPVEAVPVEGRLKDNQCLDFADGLMVIHVPGHCLGQLAFLSPKHGGILIAADAAANVMGLGWSIGYEDMAEAKRSLHKLAKEKFSIACFGHGKPILTMASQKFREKWPQ